MTSNETDPVNDLDRLLELSSYDLESPKLQQVLDGFAERAAKALGMPVGLVSLVLDSAQYFAGMSGLQGSWLAEAHGTPVEWSFCASAVRSGQAYVVPDATVDPIQQNNPLVLDDGVRSYAGAPLLGASGKVLGTCCVVGYQPHEFTDSDVAQLQVLAAEVMTELAAFQFSRS